MQDTQNNHRLQGHLLGAFSVLVWGTTFVATKVLLRTFSPIARLSRAAHRRTRPDASAEKMA